MEQRNGASRIPRYAGNKNNSVQNGYQAEPLPNIGHKPSRLEQMQVEYQKNILREKEEKLINLYEENQQKALQRVNQKKGTVRDFFNERRAMGTGDQMSPTIEQHYQQKRNDSKINGYDSGYGNRQSPKYMNHNKRNNVKGMMKQSAGRDRSNLLAPIQRNGPEDNDNPFAKRKAQIVRPRTMGKLPNKENMRNPNMPMSAPTGEKLNGYNEDESPPPNPQQLLHLQQKRKMLQSQRSSTRSVHVKQNGSISNRQRTTPESSRKPPSSLNTYEYEPSDEDEGFGDNNSHSADDEIKRKQQELLAQIEAQQRELERLRTERKQAEVEVIDTLTYVNEQLDAESYALLIQRKKVRNPIHRKKIIYTYSDNKYQIGFVLAIDLEYLFTNISVATFRN